MDSGNESKQKSLNDGKEAGDQNAFSVSGKSPTTRAWFDTSTSPAHLLIRNVSGRDEGSYRCKVHFRHSPSWSQRITLSVKDPPGFPRIQTESGARLEGPIGPFEDGTEIRLVCVTSGDGSARLAWGGDITQAGSVARESSDPANLARLTLMASRATADSRVTCSTLNSTAHTPTFTVEVIIRTPVSQNVSESTVSLVAGPGDDGAQLVCKAFSTNLPGTVLHDQTILAVNCTDLNLPGTVLHDQTILAVNYIPVATLNVATGVTGSGGTSDNNVVEDLEQVTSSRARPGEKTSITVREGTTVAMTCHVIANPSVYNVTWFHNGKPVSGPRFGLGVRGDSRLLRLRAITRDKRGLYTCVASNDEGDGQSNAVNINVEYAPVCASGQQQEYIVPRGASVTVSCTVEAFPPSVTFTWAKKNLAAPATRLPNVGRPEGSVGRYTVPAVYEDQLEILCWAKNVVGSQKVPCSYYIYAQGRPGPVNNCSVSNHTATGFVVSCHGWPRRGSPLDSNYTLLLYNQVGRVNPELMGEDLTGNLVPSVTNFKESPQVKGQHHPGMTVAEIGLQRNTVSKPATEATAAKEDAIPRSSVLTSLGDLVRNITSTEPLFVSPSLPMLCPLLPFLRTPRLPHAVPPPLNCPPYPRLPIRLPGSIARSPLNIPIARSESGSASIDKNGHGTLTSIYDTVGRQMPPQGQDGGTPSSGSSGQSEAGGTVIIPPMFLLLAGSLVAIIMVATIVIFTIRRRGQIRKRREAEQVKISESQEYYQAQESVTAETVIPNSGVERKTSGATDDQNSSCDSDSTHLKTHKVTVDVLGPDSGGPMDGRGNQDGVSSDSNEMLITPTLGREKGINIIALGEKPATNFDASAVLTSAGNSGFRVRSGVDHQSTNFGVQTSGILRRSCLNSTPNLATISGLAGDLEYNIAAHGETNLLGSGALQNSTGHATLGRTPSFSAVRNGTSYPATLGRNLSGFAVLEVDRLRHTSPSQPLGRTITSTSFPSPPTVPSRSGVVFSSTIPTSISTRPPSQSQISHDGSIAQSSFNMAKIPSSVSQITFSGDFSQQQFTGFTPPPPQLTMPCSTIARTTNASYPHAHILPPSLCSGAEARNVISYFDVRSGIPGVPTTNYGIPLSPGINVTMGGNSTGVLKLDSVNQVCGVPVSGSRAPTSVVDKGGSQNFQYDKSDEVPGFTNLTPTVKPFSETSLARPSEACERSDNTEALNTSGNVRIGSPSRSAMRHGAPSIGPKPTVSFDIDENVPQTSKKKSDIQESLSSL
ncbi:uncharacterized protein LOC108665296 [Hyalella azteca]|uniref:Uncharacterized protein LOC108665296 n=1 Tax=Hyalella azteca TaxID=294128 RepID=A0A979FIQ6_HYAAZ|nr:uncharacterized protein LOC108665296 [Hyalella azteca]